MRHIALVLVATAACAGKSTSTSGQPDASLDSDQLAPDLSAVAITTKLDQRVAAAQAQVDYWQTLPTDNPGVRAAALVQHLLADPTIADAVVSEDGVSVWARFHDGVELAFAADRPSAAPPSQGLPPRARASSPPPGPRLSGGDDALLVDVLGLSAGAVPAISPWLASSGFNARQSTGALEELRNIGSPRFFMFTTHGMTGPARNGRRTFALGTSSVVNPVCDPADPTCAEFEAQIAADHIAFSAYGDGKLYWMIKPAFVRDYWKGIRGSVIYLDACNSGTLRADPIRQQLVGNGARLVLGWTDISYDVPASWVSMRLLDRVLGANTYNPEKVPQRPFPFGPVVAEMRALHLLPSVYGGHSADLSFFPAGADDILVPGIEHLEVDETKGEVSVAGDFGLDEPAVTVGGTQLTISLRTPNSINATLPGPRASGLVRVTTKGRSSNDVPLSSWGTHVNYTVSYPAYPGLVDTVTCDLHFRGDVHLRRRGPGDEPTHEFVYFPPTSDSNCRYDSGTSGASSSGDVMSHQGSGTLPWCSLSANPTCAAPYYDANIGFRADYSIEILMGFLAPITETTTKPASSKATDVIPNPSALDMKQTGGDGVNLGAGSIDATFFWTETHSDWTAAPAQPAPGADTKS